jgi:hypothetical protein
VFDAGTGADLGRAELSDQASPAVQEGVMRGRRTWQDKLARELKAVEKTRRQRYARRRLCDVVVAATKGSPTGRSNPGRRRRP